MLACRNAPLQERSGLLTSPCPPIFLPPAHRFTDDDEAVLMANDTEYGLAAYFYTRDLRRAWKISEQLEYGMVSVHRIWLAQQAAAAAEYNAALRLAACACEQRQAHGRVVTCAC